MSDPYPSEVAPPEEEVAPPIEEVAPPPGVLPEAAGPEKRRSRSGWIAPAWFFLGIIVGIAGFAAYNALTIKPAAPVTQTESLDPDAMRTAARQGVLEAIATLQAGGQPAAQEPQGPQTVASNAFTVREANRQGSANATVTIYEFSDFQ